MRALLRTILGLFVALSLGMGAVAPAGEALFEGPVGMCVEGAVHERDDESRNSDAAKWGLHEHGGCHGHHQADALARTGDALPPPVRSLNFAAGTDFLPQLVPDANLRPPSVVALHRNLGEGVRRGEVLAVIESRDAAALRAEVEAAGARAALAREERLFNLKVPPERDVIAARTAMAEANIALRLAQQQPVVMTTLVASLGFVPMALATGAGAEAQKPLATVVIGGLVSATLLTLFVLPTLYARYGRRTPA